MKVETQLISLNRHACPTLNFKLFNLYIFGVFAIAQLVEVMDRAVLDGVVEVVSSDPAVGHEYFSIYHLPA